MKIYERYIEFAFEISGSFGRQAHHDDTLVQLSEALWNIQHRCMVRRAFSNKFVHSGFIACKQVRSKSRCIIELYLNQKMEIPSYNPLGIRVWSSELLEEQFWHGTRISTSIITNIVSSSSDTSIYV